MAISSTVFSIDYAGNASAVTPYQIPFQFLDPTHIVVEVLEDGEEEAVELDQADYTITHSSDRTGSLVTDVAWPANSTVTIRRATPLLQPSEYPESGPFPAESHETALDRLTMIAQEISGGEGGGLIVPPDPLRDVVRWDAAVDRPGVVPYRRGQVGIQMSDASIYMAESTTQGDWTLITGPADAGGYKLFANTTARNQSTPEFIGQIGVQLDTTSVYTASGTAIGDWAPAAATGAGTRTWADATARAAADPDFIGQLGIQLDDDSLWLSTDLAPGDWALFSTGGGATTSYPRASVQISATEIDWNASRTFYKTVTADHAFTFANAADGMSILVRLSSAGGFTPTWPVDVDVDWDDAAGVSWVTFANVNGHITSSTVFRP